jgi:hypothetical protein
VVVPSTICLIRWLGVNLWILTLSLCGSILLFSLTHAKENTPRSATSCINPFTNIDKLAFSPKGWRTNFCLHSVPYQEIQSGGPPRDGIPPLDHPTFVSPREANAWLKDREPVIAFGLGGDMRAYPLQVLIWHEIVNDVVNNQPVVVTFCPLCNTALVFERSLLEGKVLTFGTSGNLRYSDLIMWDRQTESWWQQFSGEAIVGDLTGTRLRSLPASIISWEDFKTHYPQGKVLSRETGFERDYGTNPYVGYDDIHQSPFLYQGPLDNRLLPMARVLGVIHEGEAHAYTYDHLRQVRVVNDILGHEPIVVFWKAGTASAVDDRDIAKGQDVGTTGTFLRMVNGQVLLFHPRKDGTFRDQETGSTWNILGHAVGGPLSGKSLIPLVHYDTFWFVWSAFVPASATE